MVDLLVTHMELVCKPEAVPPAPQDISLEIRRERMISADYLALYAAIGAPVQWDQRLRMPRPELEELLLRDSTITMVLRTNGMAVGLCEFVNATGADVEIANFGLIAQVQGKGLGAHLLGVGLHAAWSSMTRRIWLRTDTNDSPKAVPAYMRAGFRVVRQSIESFQD